MAKFIIEPHFRLHEWVAEEKGYFRDEGLDYEFRELVRATDGKMEVARQAREFVEIADRRFGLAQQPTQLSDVFGRCVFCRKFGAERLDGALRVHDFGSAHAGEIELHRERFGKQPRITVGNAGAAAFAHADFDDAEGFERAQRVARNDAAGIKPRRQIFFSAEKIPGPQPFGKQRIAHFGHDLCGQ